MDESKASVLIVDDRPEQLLSLEAVLEDLSLNTVRAYNGREALRHVLNQEFAVILLDVNMPDMDGFETARLIRQRKNSAHVPIIFLTAMGDEMHVARGYSLGAVDYILTPVVPQVLRSKVVVFVDLFRKTQQVKLQAERLRQRATQLHQLTGAALTINLAQSVEKIAQTAAEQARRIIGAHQAVTVLNALPHHGAPEARHASYSDHCEGAGRIEDPDVFIFAAAASKPIRMTGGELESHLPVQLGSESKAALRGLLASPLVGRNEKSMGMLMLTDRSEGEFSDDDQAVLVQLAQMAAVAIENTIFAEERETNRLKNEFLSTLSHELRTPLNAISVWVQLLKMGRDKEQAAHGLEVIARNVKAQTKLIEDLLDLSRVTSGKLRLNVRPTCLRSVVESTVEALRPMIEAKGITVCCEMGVVPSSVNGDPDRLGQVVSNILNNAAKFTSSGGSITLRLTNESDSVRLAISDSGEGIEPELLPYVFERFRQADSSSTRRHSGLGIGLTIVKHIMSLHGGTVAAESAGKDRGATFTLSLPLVADGDLRTLLPTSDNGAGDVPSLNRIRVLLVDDEPDAREVVAELLQRHEADVTTAASAAEAMKLATASCPDVLVTDLAMPDQDGFALLRELRRLPAEQGGALPAVALTAYARPEDRENALRSGFEAHLAKPIDPSELIRTVHRCAKGRNGARRAS